MKLTVEISYYPHFAPTADPSKHYYIESKLTGSDYADDPKERIDREHGHLHALEVAALIDLNKIIRESVTNYFATNNPLSWSICKNSSSEPLTSHSSPNDI